MEPPRLDKFRNLVTMWYQQNKHTEEEVILKFRSLAKYPVKHYEIYAAFERWGLVPTPPMVISPRSNSEEIIRDESHGSGDNVPEDERLVYRDAALELSRRQSGRLAVDEHLENPDSSAFLSYSHSIEGAGVTACEIDMTNLRRQWNVVRAVRDAEHALKPRMSRKSRKVRRDENVQLISQRSKSTSVEKGEREQRDDRDEGDNGDEINIYQISDFPPEVDDMENFGVDSGLDSGADNKRARSDSTASSLHAYFDSKRPRLASPYDG